MWRQSICPAIAAIKNLPAAGSHYESPTLAAPASDAEKVDNNEEYDDDEDWSFLRTFVVRPFLLFLPASQCQRMVA